MIERHNVIPENMYNRAVRGQYIKKKSNEIEYFHPHLGEGIFWGAVCAVGYGSCPHFIIKGLGPDRGLVDSLAAGLVSYTAAAIIITIAVASAGGIAFMRDLDRTARNWFVVSGVFVFVSQMLRYMALAIAPVTVVVPIQRLSIVFRIIFSWILNRDHEVLTAKVLIGIAISLVGALALTLSTDIVLSLVPTQWAEIVTLEWP